MDNDDSDQIQNQNSFNQLDEQNLVQDNKKSEKFEIDDPW